ncbi:phosphoenolpyruvate synthase [Candidatus Woesearchaeota archaeon]|nr:phosphoenolpyruvate synthase [Candidatus Woesearchaeota archaeon]
MKNILWFQEISKNDGASVGGKGANLGEMYNAHFPIPNGFVVTSYAYKNFLEVNKLQPEINKVLVNTDVDNNEQLQKAAQQVQSIILKAEMPKELKQEIKYAYENLNVNLDLMNVSKKTISFVNLPKDYPFVAVRSSATAEDLPDFSFAGQQATYINIKNFENVVQAVHQCWASLFTARAIYYREKNNFEHEKVLIAVVIQKMVDSDKAGVMFSMNPGTNDKSEVIIEASFGFGDAVVSGAVSPDRYVVDKNSLTLKDMKIGNKLFMFYRDRTSGRTSKKMLSPDKAIGRVLTDWEVGKLASLAKKVEAHYEAPQDMEFAIENSSIFLVQTRGITTNEKVTSKIAEEEKQNMGLEDEKAILTGISASPGIGSGHVKIVEEADDLDKVKHGDVLVARMTNPDYVAAMERASAIVTDEGGQTCHAAIVSREMGIPAVVGTGNATKILKENDLITVDGKAGKVYRGAKEVLKEEINIEEKPAEEINIVSENVKIGVLEPTVTKIKVIADFPDLAHKAAATGAEGVGLLRCEFMILSGKEHPGYLIDNGREEELISRLEEGLTKVCSAFKGKTVWYRSLDARTDEFRDMVGGENEPKEDNPMMGWRSIRRDLDQPELFKAQLEALRRVRNKGFKELGLMLPMITHLEQVRHAKEVIKDMGLEDMEFGIMVETPAVVQMMDEFCEEGIDFISIGTNDLTQFTLAIDRNNSRIQKWYNEMHPAVLKEIRHVIKTCKKHHVKTSICGQAGSNADMAKFLVDTGIDEITVNVDAVSTINKIVADEERRLVLEAARK